MIDEDIAVQHVAITIDLPSGPGTNTVVLHTVLDRLEHDGLRPSRTTVEITEQPTA